MKKMSLVFCLCASLTAGNAVAGDGVKWKMPIKVRHSADVSWAAVGSGWSTLDSRWSAAGSVLSADAELIDHDRATWKATSEEWTQSNGEWDTEDAGWDKTIGDWTIDTFTSEWQVAVAAVDTRGSFGRSPTTCGATWRASG